MASLVLALALNVPFLPQTEDLCGGAAAAMVFRYWGDAHADPQQFAELVDRRAGGIDAAVLIADIKRRGWDAHQFNGSIERLRDAVERGRPLILLIQDRPRRFHFVVVSGNEEDTVVVHDPARGPARRLAFEDLLKVWEPTGFWALSILPGPPIASAPQPAAASTQTDVRAAPGVCDRLLADAVDDIRRRGMDEADDMLGRVRASCPQAAGPIRELAAVRFAQHRWAEATKLAEEAIARGDADAYASELLAASLYMRGDAHGALAAWNRIGKPRINLVRIQGVRRTRYPLLVDALDLPTNALLTEERFRRAERRLNELPDRSSATIAYHIERDGYATVDVVVAEHSTVPAAPVEWTAAGTLAVVDREVRVALPGAAEQGELWSATWRYWESRPRLAMALAAPRTGRLPGVWRVEGAWEAQAYARGGDSSDRSIVRETHAYGRLAFSDWLSSNVRYQAAAGIEAWNDRKDASIGLALDRRFADDRLSLIGSGTMGLSLTDDPSFSTASLRTTFRSSPTSSGWQYLSDGGVDVASAAAPIGLWPAAGDGHTGEHLLRAHPLLDRGIITGPMFGRSVRYANVEARRWLNIGSPIRLGAAVFADAAERSGGSAWRPGRRVLADVGGGVRFKLPGRDGILRIDLGYGLRDRAHAVTFGWTTP